VLERYPNLRIGLGESGIGWLPYALDRMDFEFRDLMKLKPSEYWRRLCRATFQFDRIGAKLVDDIGVETLMWGPRLSAPRRRMAGILKIHRGAVRGPAGRGRAQDHLRKRRQILRPDQLTAGSSQSAASDVAAYSASKSGAGAEGFLASETMRPARPA
jgi:hypothetical protein